MKRSAIVFLVMSSLLACGGGGGGGGDPLPPQNPPVEPPATSADTVNTQCGSFQGEVLAGSVAFKGIPYAKPPVDERRWLPPQTADCVEETQPALAFASACVQLDDAGNVTSLAEDCLFLNLWTPVDAFPNDERKPVLFFIHGGGNQRGSPDIEQLGVTLYDGGALAAAEDVIVITVGYRLGALGFLAHPALAAENTDGRAGNYGLLDQVAALEWVQRHIADFGGDPERVVVFGESGGARDVCSLVASPLASGLFSGAIMQSGGCRQRTQAEAEPEARGIAEAVGCSSLGDSTCLRAASPGQLLDALGPESPQGVFVGQNIGPVVDGYALLDSPERVIQAGAHNQVPMIIGANTEETGAWVLGLGAGITEAGYETLVRAQFSGPILGDLVLAQYPASDYATPADAYVALSTDSQFICPARSVAQSAAVHSQPVYVYRFAKSFESPPLQAGGAFHGIELFYIFRKVRELGTYTASASDLAVEESIGGYWSALARSGDPNAGSESMVQWQPYGAASDNVLMIDAQVAQGREPRAARCNFWRGLGGGN